MATQDDQPTTRGGRTIADINAIMRDGTLSPECKTLWALYRCYDYRGDGAWPGDDVLAEHMGQGARSVQRYRAELLRRGFLEQRKRGPLPAVYRAVVPDAPTAKATKQEPALLGGWSPWCEYGVDSQEQVVVAMEQMYRLWLQNESPDGIPDDMYDTWGEVWEKLNWGALTNSTKRYRGNSAEWWTAWRAGVHRQLSWIGQKLGIGGA